MIDIEELKYPIGQFAMPIEWNLRKRNECIKTIAQLPEQIKNILKSFNKDQLDLTYREGGWSVRQVIHHLADSHMNSYIRFKWSLTEDNPLIKAYNENDWSTLSDYSFDVESSLILLEGLHARWTQFLRSLKDDDFKRTFVHPESNKTINLNEMVALYAWHSRHHLGHIQIVEKQLT